MCEVTQYTQVAVGDTQVCEQVSQSGGCWKKPAREEVAHDLASSKPGSREEAILGHTELGKEV